MSRMRKKRMDSSMIFELENGEIESSSSVEELSVDMPEPYINPSSLTPEPSSNVIAPSMDVLNGSINNNDSEVLETSPGTATSIEGDNSNSQSNIKTDVTESKIPLISIKFKDKLIAKKYKTNIRLYIAQLMNFHENYEHFESDSDTELNIWPSNEITEPMQDEVDSNLFILDTNPGCDDYNDIPAYTKKFDILDNVEKVVKKKDVHIRVQECFNCDGSHNLRECTLPRDFNRIKQKRNAMMNRQTGRYHVEEQSKAGSEGDFVAGRISGSLRKALGLEKYQLPLHIYRMRELGYPPGWLLNAQITHSGITMFDSMGVAVADPEDEEGELFQEGSKNKYDIKKILDFPGFNIPASSKYQDESEALGYPQMRETDSKIAMLEHLAPRLAQAYKRKKMPLISPSVISCQPGDASLNTDMEIDDGGPPLPPDPFIPPLPTENIQPPPPPPPESLPPLPLPADASVVETSTRLSISPSLDDLESRKMLLLAALDAGSPACTISSPSQESSNRSVPSVEAKSPDTSAIDVVELSLMNSEDTTINLESSFSDKNISVTSCPSTPKVGEVRQSKLGTPVVSSYTPYSKRPDDDKFAKDICDVINFENLPDSTGKYEQMSGIIKKVRTAVSRMQQEM